jgi:lipopolysaccharide transport system permease protein
VGKNKEWDWEIGPGRRWFQWDLAEAWQYKDLLFRFIRRDLIANYQQTVLGPFWMLLQPILTTLVYFIIFGRIVRVSTDGAPAILFYLPGVIVWGFFSDCLTGTMYTFFNNSAVFSKVYFPRLIVPVSNILAQSVRLSVQMLLFFLVYLYFFMRGEVGSCSPAILLLPLLLLQTALFGLGAGLIISVIMARYRDLDYTIQFVLRLALFACPVVYPASIVPSRYQILFWLNPLTPVMETFRAVCFGRGVVHTPYLLLSFISVFVILLAGVTLFKRQELNVIDII